MSGIGATITYVLDGVWKLRELRRRLRAQRLAINNGDAKTDVPYVDEIDSPTETVTTPEEPHSPTTA